ncbi:MAG: N-6 DNA methylase [Pseudonocardia sp.]
MTKTGALDPVDGPALRKQRGAFFTPYPIAEYLAQWAVRGGGEGRVLDPTCGEGVFLLACARQLESTGVAAGEIAQRLHGIDVHARSLEQTAQLLGETGTGAQLMTGDFFEEPTPGQVDARLPWMDAVIGNPPFVRYQAHRGAARARSAAAALSQGVRLSGLASSWAATLVHASAFLAPQGRLAMVVPAELFTVDYAEPVRLWLRERFARVHLVLFDELQFADASEQVVLLVAGGSGGTRSFGLHRVGTGTDLPDLHAFDGDAVPPPAAGKWTDLLLPVESQTVFRQVLAGHFVDLDSYAQLELGTVTGANDFFAVSESTRLEYNLEPGRHLTPMLPPGGRALRGAGFSAADWEVLRGQGDRVWMLNPVDDHPTGGLARYLARGKELEVDRAYKCSVRTPWWRPRVVPPPDLFMTYMSHVTPRLVTNSAGSVMVNSTHAVRLRPDAPPVAADALPIVALNSVTMLGAEVFGRSYGGGVLKMELKEAARLPLPDREALNAAWTRLEPRRSDLDSALRAGRWRDVVTEVDAVLLGEVLGLEPDRAERLRVAAATLRRRRLRSTDPEPSAIPGAAT